MIAKFFKETAEPEQELILWGKSFGVATSIYTAMNNSDLFDLCVFESGFTSGPEAIAHNVNRFTCCLGRLFAAVTSISWRSIDRIEYLKQPILFVSGTADKTVPNWMTHKLHKAAINSKNARIYEIEGAGHNRLWIHPNATDYWDVIENFLAQNTTNKN